MRAVDRDDVDDTVVCGLHLRERTWRGDRDLLSVRRPAQAHAGELRAPKQPPGPSAVGPYEPERAAALIDVRDQPAIRRPLVLGHACPRRRYAAQAAAVGVHGIEGVTLTVTHERDRAVVARLSLPRRRVAGG